MNVNNDMESAQRDIVSEFRAALLDFMDNAIPAKTRNIDGAVAMNFGPGPSIASKAAL
jgi:hypothetical protein